jgi:formylglycine-generating enzyme required for sulfatase activity
MTTVLLILAVIAGALLGSAACRVLFHFLRRRRRTVRGFTNSIGMEMLPIPAGSFRMGESHATPPELGGGSDRSGFPQGDWDEKPVHRVTISHPFTMSRTAVTAEQYRRFRPEYAGGGRYVINISWHEAVAFCQWLSKKEGVCYRLPTEAEWEYACRAGTDNLFSSGEQPPQPSEPNAWGLLDMHNPPAEWCLDWHGLYHPEDQTDPVGPAWGFCKVVRGGGLQETTPYYARCANRGGLAPDFPPPLPAGSEFEPRRQARLQQPWWNVDQPPQDGPEHEGHYVGFRVVQAGMPQTQPYPADTPFVQRCVRGPAAGMAVGPEPARPPVVSKVEPHFRVRPMLPVPPENQPAGHAGLVGMHPGILGHNHSPGLAVCPNGDLLAVHFTASSSSTEYLPNVAYIATRLRHGADRWDWPDLLLDFPDVTEEGALLWNDGGVLHLVTGGVGLNGVPFKWCSSRDSGATWDEVKFPLIAGRLGPQTSQPIASAFRDCDAAGTIYLAGDGVGGTSVLWASRDNGQTWFDTGGRTGGRHTAFVLLKDGTILGLGGKNTDIDGWMPQSLSRDGGKSWQVSKSPFPALAGNQRPALLRLASGRLFFASDFQSKTNRQPAGVRQRGSFVALSEDEGKTWRIKPLAGAQPHKGNVLPPRLGWGKAAHNDATIGYAVAVQSDDGVIHLITTINHPCLHFELNEAWILDPAAGLPADAPISVPKAETFEEKHSNGRTRCIYSGGRASDGRWLLEGEESWFYESGAKQYQATWRAGRKIGTETYRSADGQVQWQWEHRDDGTSVWTQYWPDGRMKSQSTWRGHLACGPATLWDYTGQLISQHEFQEGTLKD